MEKKEENESKNELSSTFIILIISCYCYDLKSLEWDNKTTLVLSNTRELNRVPNTE